MAERRARDHLYEIDVIRAVTALCVVGVHSVAFTVVLAQSQVGLQIQSAAVSALHFTREIFIAITGFVLLYTYANRPFSAKTFWRKRGIGVLLPYVVWSLFYDWRTKPPLPPGPWLLRAAGDLLTGGASFQLYFILLTLEFYLILPWFLPFMRRVGKRPWRLLAASFALQLVALFLDYRYLQAGPFSATALGQFLNGNQSRLLPLYQFYMIFGALAAMYVTRVRAFVLKHGAWTVAGLAVGLVLLWGNFIWQVDVARQGTGYAISVFQPAMAVYGLAVSAFLYWITYRWAVRRAPAPPRGHRFWLLLSNASFGIYLMHAYVLDVTMDQIVPRLPAAWPEPLRVVLVWMLVAGTTAALCSAWLYIPGLSRLVGRPCALRRDAGLGSRLDALANAARNRTAGAWSATQQLAIAASARIAWPQSPGHGQPSAPRATHSSAAGPTHTRSG